ncbi:MAG: nitrous oxide reductase accessory protein NosL, partial [Thiovulaceae bacterium]|nr:nitrous oxide reductase accessory protein NosL [Sulfurimonadaceae bacterium]
MKRVITIILVLSSVIYAGNMDKSMKQMQMFQSVPMGKATILQDGKAKMFCSICGMTLPMFYKTNHAAIHEGHTKQYCSLHCLAEDKIKNGFKAKDIKVVDTKTLKFIDAAKATYVVGSSKKGTMTMKSKYAFLNTQDAQAFAKENGGELMDFDKTFAIASNALDKEMKMIGMKQAKMAKKGEMMYNKMCKKTDKKFASVAEAKAFVKS